MVEQGQLELDPSAIQRLEYLANDLMRKVLKSGVERAEMMTDNSRKPELVANLRLLQKRISEDGLQIDPSLVKRIDDCLDKPEE